MLSKVSSDEVLGSWGRNVENGNQEIVFVGGAPRTGTTLLQALICTSPRSNAYVGECSYLTAFIEPYHRALGLWEIHTKYYFCDVNAMCEFHGKIIMEILSQFRRHFGEVNMLVLKDPCLTSSFHILCYLLPEAKFAVTVRDPRDAILSRLEVMERSSGVKPGLEEIEFACAEYNAAYAGVIQHWEHFGNRLILVPYASLVLDGDLERLASFGLADLRPNILTESTWKEANIKGNPWNTDLYGGAISAASIDRYKTLMDDSVAEIVLERCGETAKILLDIAKQSYLSQPNIGSSD
ncbi:sulfotransferase family protein [Methylorubrum extorquens]|uniref:sulfotransferase family protein n=1 Tax=Methylorubrum extorquens TaxID=408 RepID=UPI001EE57E5A|nr:sulfotransferase [Methylorubrum extorquens]MCG5247995.1 sulfotransferase [Methylorubrum extorquens]